MESSKKAVKLAEKYDFIYATCGISPNDIPQDEERKQIDGNKFQMEIEKCWKKKKKENKKKQNCSTRRDWS